MTDVVIVECYSGSRYAERPLAVHIDRQRLAVEHVERAWRTPAGPAFLVVVTGGQRLQLEFDERSDTWTATTAPLQGGHT